MDSSICWGLLVDFVKKFANDMKNDLKRGMPTIKDAGSVKTYNALGCSKRRCSPPCDMSTGTIISVGCGVTTFFITKNIVTDWSDARKYVQQCGRL